MKNYIYLVLVVLLFSCKKEDEAPMVNEPHTYTGSVCASGYPPVISSCLDSLGQLLFFHVPLRQNSIFNSPVDISAKIMQLKGDLTTSIVKDLGQDPFNTSSYTNFTVGSQSGFVPTSCNVSIDMTSDGRLFLCRSDLEAVFLYGSGSFFQYQLLQGITSIEADKKTLYATVGPIYDTAYNLVQWPRIYMIDSSGSMSLYFEFPSTYSFGASGLGGIVNNLIYPIGFAMEATSLSDGSLLVTFGSDNIIYKIDKNKNVSVFNAQISFPVSIDAAFSDEIFVVSPPQYDSNVTMIKPVEVYLLDQVGNKSLIYSGTNSGSVSSGLSHYSVSAASWNRIFLTNPREGNVVLIQ